MPEPAVRLVLRQLRPGDVDHELLWSLVGLGALGIGILWVAAGAPALLSCPLRAVTGLPCPTCGSTRAWLALFDGRILAALRLNPLASAVALLAPAYVLYGLGTALGGLPRLRVELGATSRFILRALALAFAALAWLFLVIDGR